MKSTFSQALFWVWVMEIAVSGFNYFYLMNRVYQPKFGLLGHNCHLSVTQAPSNWHKMTQLGIIARLV